MAVGKGINENMIPAAKEKIAAYKTAAATKLSEFKESIDFSTGFIGESQSNALNAMFDRLMEHVTDTFSFLDSFGTTIDEVRVQYQTQQDSIAEIVSGSVNE